mgnify:CR=1 FL=1|tara:strand:+ start:924 stop:1025 length:102 start_codon:yes stop_codon:yes gene_type:complete
MKVYGDKVNEKQFSQGCWGKYPSEEVPIKTHNG